MNAMCTWSADLPAKSVQLQPLLEQKYLNMYESIPIRNFHAASVIHYSVLKMLFKSTSSDILTIRCTPVFSMAVSLAPVFLLKYTFEENMVKVTGARSVIRDLMLLSRESGISAYASRQLECLRGQYMLSLHVCVISLILCEGNTQGPSKDWSCDCAYICLYANLFVSSMWCLLVRMFADSKLD